MLADPAFKHYHARFAKPKDADITPDLYDCNTYYSHEPNDTLMNDSLMEEEEIMLDESGAPIEVPIPEGKNKEAMPEEQAVKLEEL